MISAKQAGKGVPAITIESLHKRFPHQGGWMSALSGVNLTVEPGSIQGIIGFSGAGKSTLIRCITRLEEPDEGRVMIDGLDLAHLHGAELRAARRRLGVVFQQLYLLRSRTAAGNIALPLELAGVPVSQIRERVRELLAWFGLEEKAGQHPAQLSGGQRQRVALARALALSPTVLLTDEPTSALDPETTASVLRVLRRVRDELGVAIVLVTHELAAVRAICDRVAVLDSGRIAEEGAVQLLLQRPTSDAAKRLMGSHQIAASFDAAAVSA